MKVAAHPLVVAAALGLVGPSALELELETEDSQFEDCVEAHLLPEPGPELSELYTVQAPTAAEFARVELEWLQATTE